MAKLAIVYGTRFGSTEEISNKIGEIAKEKGIEPTIVNAKDKKAVKSLFSNLSSYDGVLLGSSVQIGMWTKAMKGILKNYTEEINSYTKPLALFVSCGMAADKEKYDQACEDFVKKTADKFGIKASEMIAFGGIFDFRENSAHGKIKSSMLKKISESESPGKYKLDDINDLRDWDRITAFANDFIGKIK